MLRDLCCRSHIICCKTDQTRTPAKLLSVQDLTAAAAVSQLELLPARVPTCMEVMFLYISIETPWILASFLCLNNFLVHYQGEK